MSLRFKANASDADDDEEEDGDDNGVSEKREKENNRKKRRRYSYSYRRGLKRAKKVVLSPFKKFNKLFSGCKRSSSSTSSHSQSHTIPNLSTSSTANKRIGNLCGCFCMSKPQTLDTSFDGGIDPSDPKVSYDYLKSLIETNDFYSKECNTHFGD